MTVSENAQLEIYGYTIRPDRDGLFRWNLYSPMGQLLSGSPVGFASELVAEKAIRSEAREQEIRVAPRVIGSAFMCNAQ